MGDDLLSAFSPLWNQHKKTQLWTKKGAYIIYKDHEYLYAGINNSGKSKNGTLLQRLGDGHITGNTSGDFRQIIKKNTKETINSKKDFIRYLDKNNVRVKFIIVDSDNFRIFLEKWLICYYCPLYNIF